MHDIEGLVDGYQRFYASRDNEETRLYRRLAEQGQSPRTMIVCCCDSRVDPSSIFDTSPGDLFVVRNVANLVPPFEPHGDYHGTSAALEFAVTGLRVESIVVMGHAHCGGVKAYLDGGYGQTDDTGTEPGTGFIDRWMSLLNPAHTAILESGLDETKENHQQQLEMDSIRCSLENLQTFPFIQDALSRNVLRLRGAYFSIFHSSLLGLDPESDAFRPVAV
ncbi:MAG: carbonic anhydrase [Rhodospirillales bacterium]|nr:carbonic anhydrase [Rhodospirillales bacterium]